MKSLKLVKRVLPVVGMITLVSGCSTTNDMYGKYDDICEVPKAKTVERVKIVKEVTEKAKIVEKQVPVEKTKYVDRIKEVAKVKYVDRVKIKEVKTVKYVPKVKIVERIKEVPKVKYVDRVKIKEVPKIKYVDRVKVKEVAKIKYVDRVKRVMVPQTKVVEKIKVVNKTQYVDKMVSGSIWEPAVYFGYDLASLDANELARLDRDIVVLKKNPKLKLSVQAFTDSHGSNQYNQKLALQRQKTVVDYLVSKGVTRNRIVLSPLGEELPILGNSAAERVVNRRVELMLLDQGGRPLSFAIQPKATDFKAPFPVK